METKEPNFRIVFRDKGDNRRHTIFATSTKELIEKLLNLNGVIISLDTKPKS